MSEAKRNGKRKINSTVDSNTEDLNNDLPNKRVRLDNGSQQSSFGGASSSATEPLEMEMDVDMIDVGDYEIMDAIEGRTGRGEKLLYADFYNDFGDPFDDEDLE